MPVLQAIQYLILRGSLNKGVLNSNTLPVLFYVLNPSNSRKSHIIRNFDDILKLKIQNLIQQYVSRRFLRNSFFL